MSTEEEKHLLTAVDEIMKKKGELEQTIMQCLFIGPPCNGKSSLMRRLLGEKPDDFLPTTSTDVVEKAVQVCIKRPASSAVKIASSSSNTTVSPWSKLSFDDEVVSLLKVISENLITPQSLPLPTQQNSNAAANLPTEFQSEAALGVPMLESSPPNTTRINETGNLVEDIPVTSPAGSTISSATNVPEFKSPREVFKDSLRKGWLEAKKFFENACIMYLTGGQIEFQELLSTLVSGPSVFFLVFRLDWDLNTIFDIHYTHPDKGRSEPYKSSLKLKDALLQSLASIASMGTFTYATEPFRPKVFFIGTHKDKVSEEKIKQIDSDLKAAVQSTSFYKEGIIQPAVASDNPENMRMLLAVNNLSNDDNDFEHIRKAVERVIDQDDFKVRAPPQWLIFSLILRQAVDQPVISYEQCCLLARQCGIHDREELNKALQFLSARVGLIRYFQKSNLSEIVIRDPKILFDKITDLIVETFTFQNPKVTNQYECSEFVKKGFFQRSSFEKISENSEYLTASRLINLLKHLHIIAPIQKDGDVMFFMPSILRHAVSVCHPPSPMSVTSAVPPLLVCFHCGYCPKGLFSALVAYLLNNGMKSEYRWLPQDEIYKDQFAFSVGPFPYSILMTVTPAYIEILCNPTSSTSPYIHETCKEVCTAIRRSINQVTSDLHYIGDAKSYLAFDCPQCSCKQGGRHGAEFKADIVKGSPFHTLYCWQCKKTFADLPRGYNIWFHQVNFVP